jgi:hypothetical protein
MGQSGTTKVAGGFVHLRPEKKKKKKDIRLFDNS